MSMVPQTRKEVLLSLLAGDTGIDLPQPISREDILLFAIINGDKSIDIKPITRVEIYLKQILDMSGNGETPNAGGVPVYANISLASLYTVNNYSKVDSMQIVDIPDSNIVHTVVCNSESGHLLSSCYLGLEGDKGQFVSDNNLNLRCYSVPIDDALLESVGRPNRVTVRKATNSTRFRVATFSFYPVSNGSYALSYGEYSEAVGEIDIPSNTYGIVVYFSNTGEECEIVMEFNSIT